MLEILYEGYSTDRDPITKEPVAEKVTTMYRNPQSYTQLQLSINYKYNPNHPGCLENELLRSPEYQGIEEKLARLVPVYTKILEAEPPPRVWLTVTAITLSTNENGEIESTLSEDKEEAVTILHTSKIPADVPKIRFDRLYDLRSIDPVMYTAQYESETCALKMSSTVNEELFKAEVNGRIKLGQCPHINEMIGVVINNPYIPERSYVEGMLLQYCPAGDLLNVLSNADHPTGMELKHKWAVQIAHGIMELHKKGIIHGDLCSRNVVIHDEEDAQIIDISTNMGYRPTHRLFTLSRDDQRNDVYALGVTIWEMLHDGKEVPANKGDDFTTFAGEDGSEELVAAMKSCLGTDGDKIPSMEEIFEMLGGYKICGCDEDNEA